MWQASDGRSWRQLLQAAHWHTCGAHMHATLPPCRAPEYALLPSCLRLCRRVRLSRLASERRPPLDVLLVSCWPLPPSSVGAGPDDTPPPARPAAAGTQTGAHRREQAW